MWLCIYVSIYRSVYLSIQKNGGRSTKFTIQKKKHKTARRICGSVTKPSEHLLQLLLIRFGLFLRQRVHQEEFLRTQRDEGFF